MSGVDVGGPPDAGVDCEGRVVDHKAQAVSGGAGDGPQGVIVEWG